MGVKNQHETVIRKKKSKVALNLPHYGMMYF